MIRIGPKWSQMVCNGPRLPPSYPKLTHTRLNFKLLSKNKGCFKRHPKECRYGNKCRRKSSCLYKHDPSSTPCPSILPCPHPVVEVESTKFKMLKAEVDLLTEENKVRQKAQILGSWPDQEKPLNLGSWPDVEKPRILASW